MLLLDGIAIAAVAAALSIAVATAVAVASLLKAAPLMAARAGRGRFDVVVVRPGLRPASRRSRSSPVIDSGVCGLQPILRDSLRN